MSDSADLQDPVAWGRRGPATSSPGRSGSAGRQGGIVGPDAEPGPRCRLPRVAHQKLPEGFHFMVPAEVPSVHLPASGSTDDQTTIA